MGKSAEVRTRLAIFGGVPEAPHSRDNVRKRRDGEKAVRRTGAGAGARSSRPCGVSHPLHRADGDVRAPASPGASASLQPRREFSSSITITNTRAITIASGGHGLSSMVHGRIPGHRSWIKSSITSTSEDVPRHTNSGGNSRLLRVGVGIGIGIGVDSAVDSETDPDTDPDESSRLFPSKHDWLGSLPPRAFWCIITTSGGLADRPPRVVGTLRARAGNHV
jgi:hypothetical protein